MKFALLTIVVPVLLASLPFPASADGTEHVKQVDRVCVGRMLIVQTMLLVKEQGKSERQYRDENPFDPSWQPAMKEEVSAVIAYVWSHSHDEDIDFSNAVMQACYAQNTES